MARLTPDLTPNFSPVASGPHPWPSLAPVSVSAVSARLLALPSEPGQQPIDDFLACQPLMAHQMSQQVQLLGASDQIICGEGPAWLSQPHCSPNASALAPSHPHATRVQAQRCESSAAYTLKG